MRGALVGTDVVFVTFTIRATPGAPTVWFPNWMGVQELDKLIEDEVPSAYTGTVIGKYCPSAIERLL